MNVLKELDSAYNYLNLIAKIYIQRIWIEIVLSLVKSWEFKSDNIVMSFIGPNACVY